MPSIKDVNFDMSNNRIQNQSNREKMKELLDAKGCGFCLAKWTQVTMHLGPGMTHSCHHVKAHKIPLEELQTNPSALHNTNYKKEIRKQMLNNERPKECDYCWRIEDNTNELSDRVFKSLDSYSFPYHDDIVNSTGNENVYPRYVEVSFSNVCNFKCSYCGPAFSSKWGEEIKQHGAYPMQYGPHYNYIDPNEVSIKEREDNPYTEAFWKWFPDALPHMHTFRITGGEPLLSKHTFKVMQYLLENPQPELEFAVNTNACPPDKLWKKFVSLLKQLEEKNCVKRITIFVSAESTGSQAEYSRHGMNWQMFVDNIKNLLDTTKDIKISFMSAFNILSLPTFQDFLQYVLDLKLKYNVSSIYNHINTVINIPKTTKKTSGNRVALDIPYVRSPDFLDIKIINKEMIENYLFPCVEFVYKNMAHYEWSGNKGFDPSEVAKIRRIFLDVINRQHKIDTGDIVLKREQDLARARFSKFIFEYDHRRFLKFHEVFPEYVDFYKRCSKIEI
jgi:MoaA/NifB/PqqE/SkfB family radical SAM enzyme